MLLSLRITQKPILLLIIIAFLLSLGYLANTLMNLANRQVTERNLKTLNYGIGRIENHIGKIEAILGTVKYDPQENVSVEDVSKELNHLFRDHPEVQNIWIASPQRRIVYASNSAIVGLDFADAECFNKAQSGKESIIDDSTTLQWTGKSHVSITVPLFYGKEFRGITGASIDLSRFDEVLKDIVQYENNMVLTILNKDRTVIASSHREVMPGMELESFWPVGEALQGREGYAEARSPVFEDERLYVYSPLLDGHWAIVMSQPVTDVYGPWRRMLWDAIPLILLCLSLLLGLTYQVIKLENIRRMEALEFQVEKSHAVAELAASVAHEIRNPITVIRGFMQLLPRRSADPKAHEYAQLTVEEVDSVETIIGEFLNLAKPHTTKQEKCNLSHVLRSVYMLACGRAEYNSVDVFFDVAEDCMVLGDGIQLKQAFLNLCANAIEATPKGGRLTISAACAEDKVVVKIKDNGQGIPSDHLKRLGEQFFSTKANASGIGLAVTYRIVKKHRGKIDVVSSVGEGTEFTVTLPLYREDEIRG